jgi:transposase
MSELRIPLNIPDVEVVSQASNSKGEIVLTIRSSRVGTRCHKCGQLATIRYGSAPPLTIRHLPILDTPVYLVISPVRYKCSGCDSTTTEVYDWRQEGTNITKGLSDYLMRCLIHGTVEDVSRKERISYKTVTQIVSRRIATKVDWKQFKSLKIIGIDEISLKKGYQDYVTIISTRPSEDGAISVLAILAGRLKADVVSFLQSIPCELRRTIESVCTDMYDGFVNAVSEVLGPQVLVVDRYHVAKLYRAPLDALRVSEMKRLKATLPDAQYRQLEGMMWIVRKQHECLSTAEKDKLALLYQHSPKLEKAHRYALQLTHIFNTHCSRKSAMSKFDRWIKRVKKSGVSCFNTFIATLEKYQPYIANYFKQRRNSGFVEGLNNLVKVIKRRCYGIFKPETLFQRLFLDLQGFKIYA